jgi:hypothetical protein
MIARRLDKKRDAGGVYEALSQSDTTLSRRDEAAMDRKPLVGPAPVAEYLDVPEKTLTQWRYLGKGPRWSKVGRHVRYAWADVERWLADQAQGGAA